MGFLIVVIFSLSVSGGGLSIAAPQDIPALTKELAQEIILFEAGDLGSGEVEILEVRQLQERARVRLRLRGEERELRFECVKTDFGPRWRLAEPLPARQPARPEETPETREPIREPEAPRERANPADALPGHEVFLRSFVDAVYRGDEAALERMFYRDTDFDMTRVSSRTGDPRAELAEKRAAFLQQCRDLTARLSRFAECSLLTVVSGQGSAADLRQARAIMPGARRYRADVAVEIMLDGQLGRITCEGLTLFADGWRIGGFADVELPETAR
jgi:hypothetical protein